MPTAPVPAYPSSTRAPWMRGARMLKSVSRSLSEVGRSPSHVGAFRRRPLNVPAMILTSFVVTASADLDQPELLRPSLLDEGGQIGGEAALFDEAPRLPMRILHDVAI